MDKLTLSIVSHQQGRIVHDLLSDLNKLQANNFQVIITINVPEDESFCQGFSFPLHIIRNNAPKGFGENHNFAFDQSSADWFVVVNPDIRIGELDFNLLLSPFSSKSVAAVAPIVLSPFGSIEDSARQFPTLVRFVKRVLFNQRSADYAVHSYAYPVDWVAGMFVVFRKDSFQQVSGFDSHRFFMYLEDADICRRLFRNGWQIMVNPQVQVIHMAQRASRRNLKHMRWHITSALRFLTGL